MSALSSIPHAHSGARLRSAGFTLVELMIAMVLGLIVIAGVTSVFLAGQQSFRTNNALADVQDGSRIAFELMARDIREAGLTGCNSVNGRVTNVFANAPENGGSAWWANWRSNTLYGYEDASTDPALTGAGGVVAGSNSLELISGASAPVAIASDDGSSFTLNAATTNLQDGDLAIVCSPQQAAILQIGYGGGTGVAYGSGSAASANCSPAHLGGDGSIPGCKVGTDYTFPRNSLISKVSAVDWYIGNNGSGKSLYRVSLQNVKGVSTPAPQEMVRNVTGMTIAYLDPAIGAIGTSYQPASKIEALGGWAGVTAVRVTLTAESTFQRASANGAKPIVRTYSFTTTVRNRVN